MSLRDGQSEIEIQWQELRKTIKVEINNAHNKYVENMIGDIKENSKPFWKYINAQKKDSQSIPPLKTINGKTAENDLGKAEALNGQFSSVFTKTSSDKVPLLQQKYPKMSSIHVTEEGVKKLLQGLNTSKACCPDEISPKILKELSHELALIIQHLFQQSLDTSSKPEEWTTANICPLYKKADRSIPANYRPVSLTCILCKGTTI